VKEAASYCQWFETVNETRDIQQNGHAVLSLRIQCEDSKLMPCPGKWLLPRARVGMGVVLTLPIQWLHSSPTYDSMIANHLPCAPDRTVH